MPACLFACPCFVFRSCAALQLVYCSCFCVSVDALHIANREKGNPCKCPIKRFLYLGLTGMSSTWWYRCNSSYQGSRDRRPGVFLVLPSPCFPGSFFLENIRKPMETAGLRKERWLERMEKESTLRVLLGVQGMYSKDPYKPIAATVPQGFEPNMAHMASQTPSQEAQQGLPIYSLGPFPRRTPRSVNRLGVKMGVGQNSARRWTACFSLWFPFTRATHFGVTLFLTHSQIWS